MPSWVTSARVETPEDVAFLSGAALAHLHFVLGRNATPQALLQERLALRAAEACLTVSGRPERAGDLRDAVHLLRLGDLPGPRTARKGLSVLASSRRAADIGQGLAASDARFRRGADCGLARCRAG